MTPQGNIVQTTCVDLRGDLLPRIPPLVKVSKPEFELGQSDSLRLSRPSVFRETGEAHIKDDQEGRAHTSTSTCEAIESSREEMDLFDRRVRVTNASLQLCHTKASVRSTVKKTQTHTSMSEVTFGENCLIYCTSIWPKAEEESAWKNTFPKKYTSFTKIHRPTQFAQALGIGVCEHIGITGNRAPLTGHLHGFRTFKVDRTSLLVLHGPVLYVDDPYCYIEEAECKESKILSMIFVKSCKYIAQNEYRFTILPISPSLNNIFDIPISGMLRDCLLPVNSPLGMDDSPVVTTRDKREPGKQHEAHRGYRYTRRNIRRETGYCKDGGPGSDQQMKEEVVEETVTSPEKIQAPFPEDVKQPDIIIFERIGKKMRFAHHIYRQEETLSLRIQTLEKNPSIIINSSSDNLPKALEVPPEERFKRLDELPTHPRLLLELIFNPSVPRQPTYSENLVRCNQIEMKHVLACLCTLSGAVNQLNGEDQERAAASALYAAEFILDLVSWFGPIVNSMCVIREECLAVVEFKRAPFSKAVGWATFSGTGSYTLYIHHRQTEEIVYPGNFLKATRISRGPYVEILKKYGWPLKRNYNL